MIIDKNTNRSCRRKPRHPARVRAAAPDSPEQCQRETNPEIAGPARAAIRRGRDQVKGFPDTFLYVARRSITVVAQLKQTEVSVAEYAQSNHAGLASSGVALMSRLIALTILMASVSDRS